MSVYSDIASGKYDSEIPVIFDALRKRQKVVNEVKAQENLGSLEAGDRVRIISGLRPKYLVGCEGIVEGRTGKPGTLDVKIDDTFKAQRYAGHTVGIPANCLEKV